MVLTTTELQMGRAYTCTVDMSWTAFCLSPVDEMYLIKYQIFLPTL
jgi:hypothetical protein